MFGFGQAFLGEGDRISIKRRGGWLCTPFKFFGGGVQSGGQVDTRGWGSLLEEVLGQLWGS